MFGGSEFDGKGREKVLQRRMNELRGYYNAVNFGVPSFAFFFLSKL